MQVCRITFSNKPILNQTPSLVIKQLSSEPILKPQSQHQAVYPRDLQ